MINEVVNTGFKASTAANGPTAAAAAHSPTSPSVPLQKLAPQQNAGDLKEAVSRLNDYVQNFQRTLAFSVDENTGQSIVKVYDSETKQLIRQIPAEETVKLAEAIDAQTASLLVRTKA